MSHEVRAQFEEDAWQLIEDYTKPFARTDAEAMRFVAMLGYYDLAERDVPPASEALRNREDGVEEDETSVME